MEVHLPQLGMSTLEFVASSAVDSSTAGSPVTVVIGRNGSGKSTMLRDMANTFRSRHTLALGRPSHLPRGTIKSIDAVVDLADHRIYPDELPGKRIRAPVPLLNEDCPERIIALSFTPFDKFSARDDLIKSPPKPLDLDLLEPYYVYLGFKTETGRASPRSRLLRVIGDLVYTDFDPPIDARVCRTLAAIGYGPVLTVEYRVSRRVEEILKARRQGREGPRDDEDASRRADLAENAGLADREILREPIHLTVDFATGEQKSILGIPAQVLAELTRQQVLNIWSVRLHRHDGSGDVDLLELSSGELNLISGFLGLAAHLVNGSLVLIDEPENSLHPEWQQSYVEQLQAVLRQHAGCHYVIATHSPVIASGAVKAGATLVRLDRSDRDASNVLNGSESSDAALVKAFDVVTSGNNYLRQVVLEGLTLVEQGQAETDRARMIGGFLRQLHSRIPGEDPVLKVVNALVNRIPA